MSQAPERHQEPATGVMTRSRQSLQQSLDQERAGFAWQKVVSIPNGPERKSYGNAVKKCPARIMTNGLGQTLAYLKAEKGAEQRLYQHLDEWLKRAKTLVWTRIDGQPCEPHTEVVERITQVSSVIYRQATQETLAVLNWFKRYVDAIQPQGDAR